MVQISCMSVHLLQPLRLIRGDERSEEFVEVAAEHGVDPAALAIRFCLAKPFVTSVIIGATTMAQLKTDIAAAELAWTAELDAAVDAVHLWRGNPCP